MKVIRIMKLLVACLISLRGYNSNRLNGYYYEMYYVKTVIRFKNYISTSSQSVPIGGDFKILEASKIINNNNNNTSSSSIGNCYVSVIVNNIKPYQNATAAGPNGINDYSSKWNYTLSLIHHNKKRRTKITSKLSCMNNISNIGSISTNNINSITTPSSNLTKWYYSINVTGVAIQLSSLSLIGGSGIDKILDFNQNEGDTKKVIVRYLNSTLIFCFFVDF
jgi:hypothetical protein